MARRRGPDHVIPKGFFERSAQVSLPFRFNELGQVASTRNRAEQIANNLATIILTIPGERVMRPTYGSETKMRVFEANDELTRAAISADLRKAFARWEPEARIEDIRYSGPEEIQDEIEEGSLFIEVDFSLVDSEERPQPRYTASIDVGGRVSEVRIL